VSSDDSWKIPPWEAIKWGLIGIGLGSLMFLILSWMEGSGRSVRVHWLVALSYYVGGKWAVGGVFGFMGCFLVGMGLLDLLRKED
jgi:hypothetical protein